MNEQHGGEINWSNSVILSILPVEYRHIPYVHPERHICFQSTFGITFTLFCFPGRTRRSQIRVTIQQEYEDAPPTYEEAIGTPPNLGYYNMVSYGDFVGTEDMLFCLLGFGTEHGRLLEFVR